MDKEERVCSVLKKCFNINHKRVLRIMRGEKLNGMYHVNCK
ncbi:hypothetical protein [Peptoniphilus ovalis]|nr:hypothetical protein [Peptoniphilus ovalis]